MKHHLRRVLSVILIGLLSFQSAAPGFAEPGVVMRGVSNRFLEEALAPQDLSSTHLADTNPARGRRPILSRLLRSKMAIGSSLALLSPLRAFAESFKQTATGAKVVFGTWDPAHPAAETAGHAAVKSLKALGVKPLSGRVYSWSQIQDFLNTHMPGYQSAQSSADGVDIVGLSKDQVLKLPNVEPLPQAPAPVATPSPIPTPTHTSIHHASWLNSHWSGLQHFVISHPWEIVGVVLASLVAVYLVHRLLPKDSIQRGKRLAFIGLGGIAGGALAILWIAVPGIVFLPVGIALFVTAVIGYLRGATSVPSILWQAPDDSGRLVPPIKGTVLPEQTETAQRLSIGALEKLGVEAILERPEVILPYLSDQLIDEGARQYPIESIEEAPAGRLLEFLISLSEAGIRPVLEGRVSGIYAPAGIEGIRKTLEALSRSEGEPANARRHVVAITPVYGGTDGLFNTLRAYGLETEKINFSPEDAFYQQLELSITKETRIVYFESITNPRLDVPDIGRIAAIVRKREKALGLPPHQIRVVVDNAFATSRGQNPLKLGADALISIPTKGETGGAAAGAVIVAPKELLSRIPHDPAIQGTANDIAHKGLLGLRLLPRRLRQQSRNALRLAQFLEKKSRAGRSIIRSGSVRYPGLESDPSYAVAHKQGLHSSYMLYWEFVSEEEAHHFSNLLRYFRVTTHAVSLGKPVTLAELPAAGTHTLMGEEAKASSGIVTAGVRVSVGIEDSRDLLREWETLFQILEDYRDRLQEIPYPELDRALTAPYQDAFGHRESLIRSNPFWDPDAARAEQTHSDNPVFNDIRGRILKATALEGYSRVSLTLQSWLWNLLSGDHRSVDAAERTATTSRHQDVDHLRRTFTSFAEDPGTSVARRGGLYYRIGAEGGATLEYLVTAALAGFNAALNHDWVGVSFTSEREALEALEKIAPSARVVRHERLHDAGALADADYHIVPIRLFGRELGAVIVASHEKAAPFALFRGGGGTTAIPEAAANLALHFWFQDQALSLVPESENTVSPEWDGERQLTIEELENLGIEEILRNPDLILPYLSDRLQRVGVRQYPMDSLEDEPARAFEYLIALAEGGIGPVLRGETSARFYPSSGMTGIREATLAFSRRKGDTDETVRRVVKVTPAYGGTDHFLEDVKSSDPERGLQVDPVNLSSNREEFYANLERVLGPDTRLVVLEAATNPSLEIPDLPRIRRIVDGARRRFGTEIYIVVDNAFATSRGVRPLEQGADVSVSVPTKAETAGAAPSSVVVARSELIRRLPPLNPRSRAVDNAVAEDGLWPLRLSPERYQKVSENAEVVARWLEDRSQENDSIILPDSVRYPKFPTHPDSAVVEREGMSGGHMIYFQMTSDPEAENFIKLLRFFRLFGHAVSLGKVISLAELPAFGTHSGMTPVQRKAAGIQSAGVRFTIGLEDPQDVIRELDAIFKILKRFRRFFWLIPYRKLDQALMAPYRTASGQTTYLVRSNPVWDKGAERRETRWSLNPVFIWVRGIILQATDWDSYRVESLLQRNFWWNHASGNHSALYPTMETGATSAGHPTPSDLGQGFQANIKPGQPPHRYYGLYGRAGSYIEGQLAFNITAGLHGYKAAMRQEWFGVSFMSVKEAKAVLDLPRVQKRLQETPGFDVVPVVLFGQELGAVVVARPEVAALLANSHMEGLSAAMPPKAVKKGFVWFQNHVLKPIPTLPVLSSLEDVEDYLAHPVAELPERPFLSPDGSFVERRLPRRGVRPAFANALVAAA